ncbi:MAG: amidase [Chloroflexota bacterium]
MTELIYKSATFLAKAIREKEVSAVEVVTAHLNRIEVVNPTLNAVVQIATDRALAEAQAADKALAQGEIVGPLHGVPVTIKDSLDTEGIISTWGTTGRAKFIPEEDATPVARLREAGAIVLGKSNTPELTLGGEMDNLVYGATHNPYDLSKSPSGSSGGAAAIIAAGGAPLDLGSDIGGSIRSPSNVCGIAGIKPTALRVSRAGHTRTCGFGMMDNFNQVGPMARYVEDLTLTLPLIAGPDPRDPQIVPAPLGDPDAVHLEDLRIAYYIDGGLYPPVKAIADVVRAVSSGLADSGLNIQEDAPDALPQAAILYPQMAFAEKGYALNRALVQAGTKQAGPHYQRLLDEAETFELIDYPLVLEALDQFRRGMGHFMTRYHAIICPPEVYTAIPHRGTQTGTIAIDKYKMWAHMNAYNMTGWPAAVVRAGTTSDGLPVGVQIVANAWREDIVLALAQKIEEIFGGWQKSEVL